MNKLIYIIFIFILSCSLNSNSAFWSKSEKLKTDKKISKILFQDLKPNENEFNPKLKVNLPIKNTSVNYYFNNNEYCDLTNSSVENYSSGLFSKLQFEDLKKAHTESVVPVSHKDYNNKYSNIDNIRNERNQQNITPLSIKESNDYLNSEYNNNNYISSQRAFKLAKQEEEIEKKNNIWWSNLKTLK